MLSTHSFHIFVLAIVSLSGTTRAAAVGKRAFVLPTDLPANWVYAGCYVEGTGTRALTGASYVDTAAMTDESCVNFCLNQGYNLAGTEYAQECYCGDTLVGGSVPASPGDCSMACTGNSAEACGAGNRLSVFNNTAAAGPYVNPGPPGWYSLGCYNDSSARTLPFGASTPGGGSAMTVALCTATCKSLYYTLAGVEYASQCFCGNATQNYGGPAPDGAVGCSMTCAGNITEYCGGPNRLDMYSVHKPTTSSSSTSTTTTSTSTSTSKVIPPTTTSTTTKATTTTSTTTKPTTTTSTTTKATTTTTTTTTTSTTPTTTKTTTTTSTTTSKTTTTTPTTTSTTSTTTKTTTTTPAPTTTTTTSTTTTTTPNPPTTTSTSTSSTPSAPAATGIPAGWSYKGCYIDNANGPDLADRIADNTTMTVESCVNACYALGYSVAGLEYSTQCNCGNVIQAGGTLASSDSDCNMPCGGNANEMCGAGNRLSVYSNGTITLIPVPIEQQTGLPGSWQYVGCLAESTSGTRVFKYQIINANANSPENCLSLCSSFGYPAGGMEYGEECYCGDVRDVNNAGVELMPASGCNMACPGAPQYLCGGGNRISYYNWVGSELSNWNYASGAAAGAYNFLLGGVVIPLITSVTVLGKVTFVEKWGTGPPNSTGAYELDLTEINNFTAAWRPMHVKTDVFCSAGLTLPDKVGRQINIGGWSGSSTYGIRLYWPNGSPGVWGTNDWQENFEEVALQAGRWYPSAMIMANGSIVVIGGENGSNGPPVPSLELLPPAGGTVYCDWLNQTDPYNLYPFPVVLPSGGIFVAYYNQARVLNENTFATSKTLPAIPGSVNNALSGRTYPFEGTAVLMPQFAPYTAPLTIMICGGSNPGPAIALDNCVSIQPEVANPQWVLERMPSQRVMTCITALPDGTYLILNGAQQGTAGFGLATNPNLNAVLYDPTRTLGNRFTVMANTTVARLYHSESLLLPDGRILVSGSDPQDNVHPQEYRVETFSPPYLLSGLPQPSYTMGVHDWSYGESVPFVVALQTGTTSTMRVSLIGSESSTHGNSMGQRILFPAFSCSGNSCTVTAPPNSHVCPPGWYQMFVLDGPTPSISQYIRIGGDPGSIGNWPSGFADFSVPGV